VREFVESKSLNVRLVEFQESTKSSALAVAVLGCSIGEIAKSVVFAGRSLTVVVISGDKRVNVEKLSRLITEKLSIATTDEVLEQTGYAVGSLPPFPHPSGVQVLLDASTRRFGSVWAENRTSSFRSR
jgi:prolyl-tRNA editing enzyme YbaK/EbsC (Cys-tRNA(Pro) deacylase)